MLSIKKNNRFSEFILFILIFLSICIIGYPLIYKEAKATYDAEIKKYNQVANLVAYYLDSFFDGCKLTLKCIADTDVVINRQSEEIKEIINNYDLVNLDTAIFWVADSQGKVLTKTNSLGTDSVKYKEFFQESMKGNTTIGGPYNFLLNGAPVVVLSVPYYEEDKIKGVVGLTIPLSKIEEELSVAQVENYITVNLHYKNGPLLLSLGEKIESESCDNEQTICSSANLKEAPWEVRVILDKAELKKKVFLVILRNLFLLTFIIAVLVFFIHYLLLLKDRSNRERNQQTEKLAVVGELAAGIAHEIRNPLTSIKGFLQLINEKKGTEIPSYYIEIMQSEANKIEEIISEIVVLAKPAIESKTKVQIPAVLQEAVTLISPIANKKNIAIILNIEPAIPEIIGIKTQLRQVFVNVLENSIDATSDHGIIKIEATHTTKKISITITDNGTGIPPEILNKISSPFFTTKEDRPGLGLLVSYRIIGNHDGEIHIESELNVGTKVAIQLPVKEINKSNNM